MKLDREKSICSMALTYFKKIFGYWISHILENSVSPLSSLAIAVW